MHKPTIHSIALEEYKINMSILYQAVKLVLSQQATSPPKALNIKPPKPNISFSNMARNCLHHCFPLLAHCLPMFQNAVNKQAPFSHWTFFWCYYVSTNQHLPNTDSHCLLAPFCFSYLFSWCPWWSSSSYLAAFSLTLQHVPATDKV